MSRSRSRGRAARIERTAHAHSGDYERHPYKSNSDRGGFEGRQTDRDRRDRKSHDRQRNVLDRPSARDRERSRSPPIDIGFILPVRNQPSDGSVQSRSFEKAFGMRFSESLFVDNEPTEVDYRGSSNWECTKCSFSNFKTSLECFKCKKIRRMNYR